MKKLFLLLMLAAGATVSAQAQSSPAGKPAVYGKAFPAQTAIPAQALPQALNKQDSLAVKVTGEVVDVCQVKGCWLDVKLADNTTMKVRFKDYAFFVPKDLVGKTVVLNGTAYRKTMSVAEQKHYAEDAGQPKAAIQAIRAPKQSITFTASGVLVK